MRVRKVGADGAKRLTWTSTVLGADWPLLVLRSEFAPERVDLGCVTLLRGDVWVEFYWWDRPARWYTVAQVSAPDGTLKGWYCDVCMPPRWEPSASAGAPAGAEGERGQLTHVDLELDLWRGADGAIALLDEADYAARREAGWFTPAQVCGAECGWAELRSLAERDALPRWP